MEPVTEPVTEYPLTERELMPTDPGSTLHPREHMQSPRLVFLVLTGAAALLLAQSPGCTHRAAVPGDDPDMYIPADAEPLLDASPDQPVPDMLILPDGPVADQIGPSSPCTDKSALNPNGRKPVSYRQSTTGGWKIATDVDAKYSELSTPSSVTSAATMDNVLADQEAAGFVTSRGSAQSIQDEWTQVVGAMQAAVKAEGGTVKVRASGTSAPTHDLFPAVKATILDVKLTTAQSAAQLRNLLTANLLGTQPQLLGNLPPDFGVKATELVVRFVTVKRFKRKLDPKTQKPLQTKAGYGVDVGDKSQWRLLVMGGVARKSAYADVKYPTGFLINDLSNGTALALPGCNVSDGCANETIIQAIPKADIIWVSDESSSMDDNRQDIIDNATDFFNRAMASGLDFRMGVTNVCDPSDKFASSVGKFCSVASKDWSHLGGADRFLLPKEKGAFSGCIKNPPGGVKGAEYGLVNAMAAVKRHLPRAVNKPNKIRKDAKLVIIVATDEYPNSLNSILNFGILNPCTLQKYTTTELNKALKPYVDYFTGAKDPGTKAIVHVIGGVCANSCGALVAHGYRDLAQKTGGMVGDVCQKDLGPTLQVIIDHIVGTVSPLKLSHVPISGTLAVSKNGISVPRSRTHGFQYREATNSIAFINVKYQKGMKVVVGYKRWVD